MSSNAKIPKFDSQIEFIRYSLANNIDTKTKFIQFYERNFSIKTHVFVLVFIDVRTAS